MTRPSHRSIPARTKFVVDAVLALAFLAVASPSVTRIAAHEWVAIAMLALVLVHLLFSWGWVLKVARRFRGSLPGSVRLNAVLDAVLYGACIAAVVSGLKISLRVLPALGIRRSGDRFWTATHALSAEVILALVGIHLALHAEWVVAAVKSRMRGAAASPDIRTVLGPWWIRATATIALVGLVLSAATLSLGSSPVASRLRAAGTRGWREGDVAVVRLAQWLTVRLTGTAAVSAPNDAGAGTSGRAGAQRPPGQRAGAGARFGEWQRYRRAASTILWFLVVPFLVTLGWRAIAQRTTARALPASDPLDDDSLEDDALDE